MTDLTDAMRDRLVGYRNSAHAANPDDGHAAALLEAGYIEEIDNDNEKSKSAGQKKYQITEAGTAAIAHLPTEEEAATE